MSGRPKRAVPLRRRRRRDAARLDGVLLRGGRSARVADALQALVVSPRWRRYRGHLSRPAVLSAAEAGRGWTVTGGQRLAPTLEVDGADRAPGAARRDARACACEPRSGLVACGSIRERYQRRREVKLSLLDLPFLPDEMRDRLPAV